MTQRSPVVIALASITAGAAWGAAVATGCVIAAWWLQETGRSPFGDPANVVFVGTGLGLVGAVSVGWKLSLGIAEAWRRGVIAVLAGFGAVLLGSASMPLNIFFSRTIAVGYLLLVAAIGALTTWTVRKSPAAGPPAPPPA